MIQRPIYSPIRSAISGVLDRRDTALTISQLLPSSLGRVAAIYTDPARPSYDECIAKNMDAIAAGRPQDCVLFSDAAGTVPVTYPIGAGQGKGLMLDRSAGLVRGVEKVVNGGFSTDTDWTKGTGWSISGGVATKVAGTASNLTPAVALVPTVSKVYEVVYTLTRTAGTATISFGAGAGSAKSASGTYTEKLLASTTGNLTVAADASFAGTIDNISVRELPGHHQQQPTAAARGEFSRRYNQLLDTATLATQSITAIATNYRLYFTDAGTVTLSGAATGDYSAGSHTITCTAGSLTLTVAGSVLTADLRLEVDATIGLPVYQRVTTASDYDETNFPTYWRAVTDDWAKSRMNPAGATKAYVFWAGQKMSDAAVGIIFEHGPTSAVAGTTYLAAPQSVAANYGIGTGGSTRVASTNSGHTAPHKAATVSECDIANDVARLTVNGATTTNSSDQGTGTYLEYDVFFGAREGTSLFANIREYAPPTILFLQPTDSLSATHIMRLRKAYAKAVGVTL
jgi:hypothetical protein